ncbi:MAG: hypothetical protein ABII23_02635 [bacterium]
MNNIILRSVSTILILLLTQGELPLSYANTLLAPPGLRESGNDKKATTALRPFDNVESAAKWLLGIKKDNFPLDLISDFNIKQSVKLISHASAVSNDNINDVMIVGTGMQSIALLYALIGKKVVFVDISKDACERIDKMNKAIIEQLDGKAKMQISIINSEIGLLDYAKYDLTSNSFDLITFIDFSGGTGPVGAPLKWMQTAEKMVKPEGYLVIDHEYYHRTLPPFEQVFPEHAQFPVFRKVRHDGMLFDVPEAIRGTYGGSNFLYRVINQSL